MFLGNWDTPYKAMTTGFGMPFYSTTTANYNAVIGSPGFGVRSATVAGTGTGSVNGQAAFDRRQNNSLQYWSPKFAGAAIRLLYGENDGEPASGNTSPAVWGGSLTWEGSGVQLGIAYERHNDLFGTRAIDGGALGAPAGGGDSKADGVKLQASYKILGKYLVGVIYENLQYETTAGANVLREYERDAYGIYTILPVGPGAIHANYLRADDGDCTLASGAACGASGTDVDMWAIGYYYRLSKRSELYVQYVDMDNGNAQSFRLGAGPAEVAVGGPGADPRAFTIGMIHRF